MRSSRSGKTIYPVSIAAISSRGFWLLLGKRRVFLSYERFPWFREFTLDELTNVRRPSSEHVRWAAFDLEVDSIVHPDRYPLREIRLRGDPAQVVTRLRAERATARRRPARAG